MGLLVVYLFIAIGISFVCSILEAVLLSTPESYIEVLIDEKRKGAHLFKRMKQSVDRPLAAILSVNTIAHTIGAAGVGAQAVKVFGEVYFGLISAILTFLILVLSEIIPKTIGARYWRGLSLPAVPVIRVFIVVAYPFVALSEQLTKLISNGRKAYTFSRNELSTMASIGYKEGIIEKEESLFIYNLLKMRDVSVEDIMTPRTVLVSASVNLTVAEFLAEIQNYTFSRIPVYENDKENVTGYVLKADVMEKAALGILDISLGSLQRSITKVYERISVPRLFQLLVRKNDLIALVIDEYGGVEGLVTMEDIVETLTGIEIVDEKDTHADYQKLAREIWEKRQQGAKRVGGV